jgi:hypothetical protein
VGECVVGELHDGSLNLDVARSCSLVLGIALCVNSVVAAACSSPIVRSPDGSEHAIDATSKDVRYHPACHSLGGNLSERDIVAAAALSRGKIT